MIRLILILVVTTFGCYFDSTDNQLPGCTSSVTNPISINCNLKVADLIGPILYKVIIQYLRKSVYKWRDRPIITQWNWTHSGGDYINTNSSQQTFISIRYLWNKLSNNFSCY